jgi:nucleoside-diphosphate-sugar epimerase
MLGETQAQHVAEWSGIPFIALRLSNVISPAAYEKFPEAWADHTRRQFNLWSYIDVRDAATACRLALETNVTGAPSYIIAAADSAMPVESAPLMASHYPTVPLARPLMGFESLQSITKAADEQGFRPAHSSRDEVEVPAP